LRLNQALSDRPVSLTGSKQVAAPPVIWQRTSASSAIWSSQGSGPAVCPLRITYRRGL
jgi:hypothetical protein